MWSHLILVSLLVLVVDYIVKSNVHLDELHVAFFVQNERLHVNVLNNTILYIFVIHQII